MAGNSKRVADSILKKAGMKATITETVVNITRFITSTQLEGYCARLDSMVNGVNVLIDRLGV